MYSLRCLAAAVTGLTAVLYTVVVMTVVQWPYLPIVLPSFGKFNEFCVLKWLSFLLLDISVMDVVRYIARGRVGTVIGSRRSTFVRVQPYTVMQSVRISGAPVTR